MKLNLPARVALTSLLALGLPAILRAGTPAPLEAYGSLPDVENAAISPDGTRIALLMTAKGSRKLAIIDSELVLLKTISVGDLKVRDFDWAGEGKLILITSQTEDLWGFTTDKIEMSIASVIHVDDGKPVDVVFSKDRDIGGAVMGRYGIRTLAGKDKAYFGGIKLRRERVSYAFDHGRPFLFEVDLDSNSTRQISLPAAEGQDREWLIDARGEIAAIFDIDLGTGKWTLRGNGNKVIVEGRHPSGHVGVIGLGYDGSTAIYYERDEEGLSNWYEVPLAGGVPRPFLKDIDVERTYWDDETGYLLGYLDADKGPVFHDPKMGAALASIRTAFSRFDMRLVDWTPGFGKALVRTTGNKDSGTWYVVDLASMRATGFAWERMAIEADMVGPISKFAYKAGDGLEMDGVLTLPPGVDAKNLPVVVLPHGGPHAEDTVGFDWWAQAFASRGYAVFQPNFRGSTNRDDAFKLAGYGEWGRKMQTDISDGVAALAERGIVDPKRACIVGASYGGYAALAGVTLQKGLYRCAVAVAPVSDLRDMYREDYRASGDQKLTKTSLLEQLGPMDRWDTVSPRRHAARADAPVLLIHGRDDTVVPYSHSRKMADALDDAGKPYQLVTLDGEDHWLSLSATRLKMLEASVGFVQKHNPAD